MPVTLALADLAPRAWKTHSKPVTSTADLFAGASRKDFNRSKQIIQSSLKDDFFAESRIAPSANGLVYAVLGAWNGHHHLSLRPEDVWFAILSQLSFYVNAHAEELRGLFVGHEGKKELKVVEYGTIRSVGFGELAERMTGEIEKNVLDPELRTWIMPDFSTTTTSDRVVASVLMMGTLQKYFEYTFQLVCGIPSVTLLGERGDWEKLVGRLDKIPRFGSGEPAQFAALLRPVLERFVRSFDEPTDPGIVEFWKRAAHKTGGSGPIYASGWVTAFCFWDEDGELLYPSPKLPVTWEEFEGKKTGFELDGVLYHRVDTNRIPPGFASVPIKVDDNGVIYHTKMLAGSVGIQGMSSGQILDKDSGHEGTFLFEKDEHGPGEQVRSTLGKASEASGDLGIDSLRPLTGWWIYEIENEEDEQRRMTELEGKKQQLDALGKVEFGSEKRSRQMELLNEIDRLEQY